MIRISGALAGPGPDAVLQAELGLVGRAVQIGVSAAANGLRDELRAQVRSAELGAGLANAVGSRVYPSSGGSLDATGLVFPRGKKAEAIFTSFNDAPVIATKSGSKLAIATRNAFLGGRGGHRPSPAEFERRTGIRLHVVPSKKPDISLLVGKTVGQKLRRGTANPSLVYFVLLPLAQNRKRLSFDALAQTWADRIPDLIESALPQGLR